MSELTHNYFLQQGDSQTFRVSNGSLINVIREDWEKRGGLLNTTILASYLDTEQGRKAAEAHLQRAERNKE